MENILIFKKEGSRIEATDILEGIGEGKDKGTPAPNEDREVLSLKELEKLAIERALKASNHNKTEAARLLGLSRDRLYRKLKAYGIES
jgi:transcriptional regulator with PAS, ATPase and Fis domain